MTEKMHIPEQDTEAANMEKVSSLFKAFEVFNKTTVELQDYYGKLEKQAQHLTLELEQKNRELNRKVVELDQTRQYLNHILESITDGVIAVDLAGRITTCNKAVLEMAGYAFSEMAGRNVDLILAERRVLEITRGGIKIHVHASGVETKVRTKDEREVPVILFASLILDDTENVIGAVFTFKDLSLIKKLEDEVERAHRLASIGEMAAGVAHEIRNPLGGIEMFASILRREMDQQPERQVMIERILEGTQRINRIVSELLNFTRSFNRTHFEALNLTQVMEGALAFAEVEFIRHQISVKRHYSSEDDCRILGDDDQLKQVFLNIFLNAAQAMTGKGGSLEIRIIRKARNWVVEVSDTGCGIAKENLPKIFDPFFTTRAEGNGLGLAISHRIVEAHKGTIRVRSRLNAGTTFFLRFPSLSA